MRIQLAAAASAILAVGCADAAPRGAGAQERAVASASSGQDLPSAIVGRGEAHDATAIFYGRLVDDPEVLARMDHELYGTFAELDRGPSPESVAVFERALRAAGVENDLHIYDGVGHGFWLRVDDDPEVRAAPAADAWRRLKAYLGRTLG